MTKLVAVFGGTGFLGRSIVKELLTRGYQVVIADLIAPEHIAEGCSFIYCDIMNTDNVAEVMSRGVDVVYNFAGLADLNKAKELPVESTQLNVLGNINILEASKNAGVKLFVYASSVYACSTKGSFYGISKFTSEKIIEEYNQKYGMNYVVVRYGSLYGPGADESNGMYNFLEQALRGQIQHKGTGEEVREYIHVRDAATLSVDIVDEDKYYNNTFTLTGLEPITQGDLFKMINEILNDSVRVEYDNALYDDHYLYTPYSFRPTVASKLTANPFVDLGQGIVECLEDISTKGI